MKPTKMIKLVVITLFILGIGYVVYVVRTKPEFQAGTLIRTPTDEYLSVFNGLARTKLEANYVLKPKYDSTICRYLYNNGKYVILEYMINISNNKNLSDLIEVNNRNELNFKNTFNNQIRCNLFTTSFKTIFPTVNHLIMSIYGSEMRTIVKNDTTLSLYSKIENFSIKCNGSDTSAVFCQTQSGKLPIEILFIKRQKMIYFLMMSINQEKIDLAPGTLLGLMK